MDGNAANIHESYNKLFKKNRKTDESVESSGMCVEVITIHVF